MIHLNLDFSACPPNCCLPHFPTQIPHLMQFPFALVSFLPIPHSFATTSPAPASSPVFYGPAIHECLLSQCLGLLREPPGRAELFLTDCQAQEQHGSFRSELCGTTVTQPGSFLLLHQLRGTSSVPPCLWGQVPERVSCDFRKREHQCPEQPQALPPEPAPFPSPFSSPLLPSPLPSPPGNRASL